MIEVAAEKLNEPRLRPLVDQWQIKRVELEKEHVRIWQDSSTPTLVVQELDSGIHQMDTMLSFAWKWAENWENGEEVRGSIRLTQDLIAVIRDDAIEKRGL